MEIDLRDFIAKTMVNICNGVGDAQKTMLEQINNQPIAPANFDGQRVVALEQKITFDISVVASSSKSKSGNGGVNIKVLSIGAEGEKSESKMQTNRIQFSIPFYPKQCPRSKK